MSQFSRKYRDKHGNIVGITNSGAEYLLQVYDTETGRLRNMSVPTPYNPNQGQSNYGESTITGYGQNPACGTSSRVVSTLDELGYATPNTNTAKECTPAQPVDNNKYTVHNDAPPINAIVDRTEMTDLEPWQVPSTNIHNDTIVNIQNTVKIKLATDITTVDIAWLTGVVNGKSPIKPKLIDDQLNNIITHDLNLLMSVTITSFIDDWTELIAVLNDLPEDKAAVLRYLRTFLSLNNKTAYVAGEDIVINVNTFVFIPVNTNIQDEINGIDTLKPLDIPNESALSKMLHAQGLQSCYLRLGNKTFIVTHGKISIHHIDIK